MVIIITSSDRRKNNEINRIIRVEILIMKSIWKLGDGITVYEIIDYLDQVYDRKYTRSTVKTYITKLKKKDL